MRAEANDEFSKVALALKEEGRTDDLITLYERVLSFNPMNINAIKAIGQLYLSKGEPQKALAKLQVPLKEGTRDKELLELLAKIYYNMDRKDKSKNALKELREDFDFLIIDCPLPWGLSL
jgi:tetratricopeptide (TPR) repeat protein